jgi:hypothetical protein
MLPKAAAVLVGMAFWSGFGRRFTLPFDWSDCTASSPFSPFVVIALLHIPDVAASAGLRSWPSRKSSVERSFI